VVLNYVREVNGYHIIDKMLPFKLQIANNGSSMILVFIQRQYRRTESIILSEPVEDAVVIEKCQEK